MLIRVDHNSSVLPSVDTGSAFIKEVTEHERGVGVAYDQKTQPEIHEPLRAIVNRIIVS